MIRWLRSLFMSHKDRILNRDGFVLWCPACRDILNGQGRRMDARRVDGLYRFVCADCACVSCWEFGPPVPVLRRVLGKEADA